MQSTLNAGLNFCDHLSQGRSYQSVFEQSLSERVLRKPTARQVYLSGLVWKPAAVDRYGRVTVDNWTYGDPATQQTLLEYHGSGLRVLLGRDPDDFNAPAIAYDEHGDLICEGIVPVKRGGYNSMDGIRDAARNRKAARSAVAAAQEANDYLSSSELDAALAILDTETPPPSPNPNSVIGGHFGSPLRDRQARKTAAKETVPEEFLRNMDTALAARNGKRG